MNGHSFSLFLAGHTCQIFVGGNSHQSTADRFSSLFFFPRGWRKTANPRLQPPKHLHSMLSIKTVQTDGSVAVTRNISQMLRYKSLTHTHTRTHTLSGLTQSLKYSEGESYLQTTSRNRQHLSGDFNQRQQKLREVLSFYMRHKSDSEEILCKISGT